MSRPAQILRVRVDLREINSEKHLQCNQFIWVSVDLTLLKSVEDFKNLLYEKFHIKKSKNIMLYLQQCLLPPDETILLLRDEDLVKVVYEDMTFSEEQQMDTFDNARLTSTSERKKRKKRSDTSLNASSEIPFKKITTDSPLPSEKSFEKLIPYPSVVVSAKKCVNDEMPFKKIAAASPIPTDKSFEEPIPYPSAVVSAKKCVNDGEPALEDKPCESNDIGLLKNDYPKRKHRKLEKNKQMDENIEMDTTETTSVYLESKAALLTTENNKKDVSNLPDKNPEQMKNVQQMSSNCKKKKNTRRRNLSSRGTNVIKERSFSVGSCLATLNNLVPKQLGETLVNSTVENSVGSNFSKNKHIRFEENNENHEALKSNSCQSKLEKEHSISDKEKSPTANSYDMYGKEQKVVIDPANTKEKTLVTNSSKETMPLWMIWENPQCHDSYKTETILHSKQNLKTQVNGEFNSLAAVSLCSSVPQNLEKSEIQNHKQAEKKNFQQYPLMHLPPSAGDTIAYKVLELSESYCPEVSDYKEARVLHYNSQNDTIDIALFQQEVKKQRLHKFEVGDKDEEMTKPVTQVTLAWPSLIEPRLLCL